MPEAIGPLGFQASGQRVVDLPPQFLDAVRRRRRSRQRKLGGVSSGWHRNQGTGHKRHTGNRLFRMRGMVMGLPCDSCLLSENP